MLNDKNLIDMSKGDYLKITDVHLLIKERYLIIKEEKEIKGRFALHNRFSKPRSKRSIFRKPSKYLH
jgi:hypothetical protein